MSSGLDWMVRGGRFVFTCVALAMAGTIAGCGGGGSQTADRVPAQRNAAQSPASAIATTYTAVTVESAGYQLPASMDASHLMNGGGQFAFDYFDPSTGKYRTKFFDGITTHVITPADWDGTEVQGVGNGGEVVGLGRIQGVNRAFVWQHGSLRLFDSLPWSVGGGINNTGQVTFSAGTLGDLRPYVYSTATNSTATNAQLTATASIYLPINDAGSVAGSLWFDPEYRAFVWNGGPLASDVQWIAPPPNGSYMRPRIINAVGDVVGSYAPPGGPARAFIWRPGDAVARDLGGSGEVIVAALNQQGVAAAMHYGGTGSPHAFVRYPTADGAGQLVELGTLGGPFSTPRGMNDGGIVVGASASAGGVSTAFAWTSSQGMVDLNTRVANAQALGLHLGDALAIAPDGTMLAADHAGFLVVLRPGTLSSAAPSVGVPAADDPVSAGSILTLSAPFTDADSADTHTALVSWGDGSPAEAAAIVEPTGGSAGITSGTHTYAAAGIYTVSVTVTDSAGKSGVATREVVVYDPRAGFATGGGWIDSPAGAYKPTPSAAGAAQFAFVSRYAPGAQVPDGSTQFRFQAANFQFRSTSYDWFVVAGAKAQFKGAGTVNGVQGFRFILTAVDGALLGGSQADRLRLKVWRYDETTQADVVVYDNQLDQSVGGEGTALAGGSILVHR